MIQSCLRSKTRKLCTRLVDPPTSEEVRRLGVVTYDIEKDGYLLDIGYAKLETLLVVGQYWPPSQAMTLTISQKLAPRRRHIQQPRNSIRFRQRSSSAPAGDLGASWWNAWCRDKPARRG